MPVPYPYFSYGDLRPLRAALLIGLLSGMPTLGYALPTSNDIGPEVSEPTEPDSAMQTDEVQESRWLRPFWRIGTHTLHSYVGFETTPLHLAGIGSTVLFTQTTIDADIQGWAAGHDETTSIAWSAPGLIGGLTVPVLLPAGLWLLSDDDEIIDAGAASLQAVAIAFVFNNLLKAITNRAPPEEGIAASVSDTRQFNFGFLRQSTFEGWPSGHMMTNMAMSAALATYYHDRPWVVAGAYGWALYMAATTTLGNQGGVHWASDVLAGGLMGWAIGYTVGKSFATRRSAHANGDTSPTLSIAPMGGGEGGMQLVVMGTW